MTINPLFNFNPISFLCVFFIGSAENHSIRVLTRSKSKAEQIFPGKKVMTILSASILLGS